MLWNARAVVWKAPEKSKAAVRLSYLLILNVVDHFIDGLKQHVEEVEKPDNEDEFWGAAPDFVASVYEHDQTKREANVLNNSV